MSYELTNEDPSISPSGQSSAIQAWLMNRQPDLMTKAISPRRPIQQDKGMRYSELETAWERPHFSVQPDSDTDKTQQADNKNEAPLVVTTMNIFPLTLPLLYLPLSTAFHAAKINTQVSLFPVHSFS